ncbi:MAG: energy transducer TonB [Gammaproteobacteria bacterium]|nr:energy transducer TonB [Gammaproteobacteria bacterium]
MALTGTVHAEEDALSSDSFESIESMIETGEAENALGLIEEQIAELVAVAGRNTVRLVEPLVLKGDALRVLGYYAAALETYDDARAIQRRHFGLHDLEQVDILYKEAETYYEQEEYTSANDRHEYAFSIYIRKFGTDSPEILPGLFTLADWYMHTDNIFTARGLYEKALTDFSLEETTEIEHRIRALSGLAQTYQQERFRPPEYTAKSEKFTPRPYGSINHPEHYYAELNDFSKGEEALLELVRINLSKEDQTSSALADAKLKLADWYLLFEKYEKAAVVYKDIWDTLEGTEQFAFVEEHMTSPKILYKPLPDDPEPPKRETTIPTVELEGRIEIALTVTERGKTKKIKQISSHPGQMLARATRQTASNSIYRPAFVDGIATTTDNVQFLHTFPYYTSARNSASSSTRNNAAYRSSK